MKSRDRARQGTVAWGIYMHMSNRTPTAGKRTIEKLVTAAGGQLQLSNLSGISQSMICRYMKGRYDSITVRAYLRLARAANRLRVPIKPEDFA